jgi:hypothetical protein
MGEISELSKFPLRFIKHKGNAELRAEIAMYGKELHRYSEVRTLRFVIKVKGKLSLRVTN